MLRSISPPGLQELKLDLRWGDPRGPMGPWGDGPWILWDDFYFFIKRIRSNMIVNYDVFFFVLLPFFFFRAISLLFYSLGLQSHGFVRHGGIYSMSTGQVYEFFIRRIALKIYSGFLDLYLLFQS